MFDSNCLMHVYLRRTGYYSHKRIRDIQWINHIDWFSVNCTREWLSASRPSWDRFSSEYRIIQGLKDWLSDIELVYRTLRHGSRIPGLPKHKADRFLAQEWIAGTPQRLSAVEFDGLRFDTTRIFHSTAKLVKPPLIIIICSHSQACLWKIHFVPFKGYFLPSWMLWICACQHTPSVIFQIRYF